MKRLAILVGFIVIALTSALIPPSLQTEAQGECVQETGFCITTPQFAEYYRMRGGSKTLGYPISRSFTLEGFEVQFFQRVVLQLQGGNVQRLNILAPGILPLTRANQSEFPAPNPRLASAAPQVGSADYAARIVEFVRSVAPETYQGRPVRF